MKIKDEIIKLQQGGGAPLPTTTYRPISIRQPMFAGGQSEGTTSTAAPATQKQSSPDNDILKNIMDQVKTRGLPSDVDSFFNSFSNVFPSFFGGASNPMSGVNNTNTEFLVNNYMSLLPNINKIEFYKENWDAAVKQTIDNDALDEFAITPSGFMVVYNTNGEIKQIRHKEYSENPEEYQPLTNGELANLRANNPNLAWDTNIFTFLNASIGSSKITDQLLSVMDKIGKESISTESISKKNSNLLSGMQTLMEVDSSDLFGNAAGGSRGFTSSSELVKEGPDNVFYKTKKVTETEKRNALNTAQYLYRMLPNNAKAVLKTRAVVNGMDPDSGELQLIKILLDGTTSQSFETSVDIIKDPNVDYTGDSGSSSKNKTEEYTWLNQIQNMDGSQSKQYNLTPGTAYAMNVISNYMTAIPSVEGEVIGKSNLDYVLNKSGLSGIVDRNSVYIGDQHVRVSDLDKIMYLGDGIQYTTLPYVITDNGNTKVDFNLLEQFTSADEEIAEKGGDNLSIAMKNSIYEKYGLNDMFRLDESGNQVWNPNKFKKFAMITTAVTNSNDLLPGIDKSEVLRKAKDSENIKKDMKTMFKDTGYKVGDIYTGVAFMPITGGQVEARTFSKNTPKIKPAGTYFDELARQKTQEKAAGMISGNTSDLQIN